MKKMCELNKVLHGLKVKLNGQGRVDSIGANNKGEEEHQKEKVFLQKILQKRIVVTKKKVTIGDKLTIKKLILQTKNINGINQDPSKTIRAKYKEAKE